MQPLLHNKKETALQRGRKRINRERGVAAALPVKQVRPSRSLAILRFVWRALWWLLEGGQLVRLRGPGLLPEERHEFEQPDVREALRRQGWL